MSNTTWVIDNAHSEISFKVKHMMFTNVSGNFDDFTATVVTDGDTLEGAQINFTAQTASVNTRNGDRDKHLTGADFFDSEKYPQLSFKSTRVDKLTDDEYNVTGDLTIKGETKPVVFNVDFGGMRKDPWGNEKLGASLTGKINRKDYGLTWNAPLEAGGVMVSDEVKLNAEVQFTKQA